MRIVGQNPINDDGAWVPVPANMQLHTAWNITISGCTFSHLGATALSVVSLDVSGVHEYPTLETTKYCRWMGRKVA
jgi:hypothetical protein